MWSGDTKCTCVMNLTPRPSSIDIKDGWMHTSAPVTAHGVIGKLHLFTHSKGVGPRAGLEALGFEEWIVKTTAYNDYENPAPPTREK